MEVREGRIHGDLVVIWGFTGHRHWVTRIDRLRRVLCICAGTACRKLYPARTADGELHGSELQETPNGREENEVLSPEDGDKGIMVGENILLSGRHIKPPAKVRLRCCHSADGKADRSKM